jgi:protease-4
MRTRLIPAALLALAVMAAATSAWAFGAIPSYYEELNFNLTSPTGFSEAVSGYANPSMYPMMPGAELEVYWSSFKSDAFDGAGRWGTFIGLENLGFGFIHNKAQFAEGERSVTDYRLGLGGGSGTFTMGLGYAWSGGDTDTFGREKFFQLGGTARIGKHVSVGANLNLSTETDARQELFDVAVRPLGNERVTVFADMELSHKNGDRIDNKPWSAGAMLEIPAGLKVIGRYFDDDASGDQGFTVGLAYTFGAGIGQGSARGSWMPRFDQNSDLALTNWGVRVGFPERSEILAPMFKDSGYLQMHVKGSPPYARYRFFDSRMTFHEILQAIDDARDDDRVGGVALNLSGAQLSRGQAWEIRQRLEDLKTADKKVFVFVDELGMTSYYVASVADRIVMDPEGLILLPGYVMGRTFVANMAEKLGLGIEEWRFLKYKSAMESLVRHEMSDADREQRQSLVDQYYQTMREDVARSRRVSQATVDRWINDVVLFTAHAAQGENLVDELGRWEELKEAITDETGGKKKYVSGRELARPWYPTRQWGTIPEVAVVYAIGVCDMDEGINARRLEKILRRLRGDKNVKAIVLRVDSPGGSPVASDVVAGQLRRCMEKKPVVISQGDVAASGGYWLSMCSNAIVAQPTTITGSIGIISGWVWDKGIGEKVGMEGDFVRAGDHADVFFTLRPPIIPVAIPHRAVTDEERDLVLAGMKTMYGRFVDAVAENRDMTSQRVEALAQGRVWTGLEAKRNGLVDRIGGLQDAIMLARELAGIGADDVVTVNEYGPQKLFRWKDVPAPALALGFPGIGELELTRWLVGEDSGTPAPPDGSYLDDYNLMYLRRLVQNYGRAQCILPPDQIPQDGGADTRQREN